jgi:hypothetical protein
MNFSRLKRRIIMKNGQTAAASWNVRRNFGAISGIMLCIFAAYAFATEQEPNKITHNGVEYEMFSYPMRPYFQEFPERLPPLGMCSGNWAGYHEVFEIIQNELWVVDIQSRRDCSEIPWGERPGGPSITLECLDGQDKMKADWYSGFLVVPLGSMIELYYPFGGFERYLLIEIENGNYVREVELDHEQYLNYLQTGVVSVRLPSRHSQTASPHFLQITDRTLNLRLSDRGNIAVYALNGAKIRTFDLNQGNHTLRLNDLPRGMYVIKASSGAWKQSVKLLVK